MNCLIGLCGIFFGFDECNVRIIIRCLHGTCVGHFLTDSYNSCLSVAGIVGGRHGNIIHHDDRLLHRGGGRVSVLLIGKGRALHIGMA